MVSHGKWVKWVRREKWASRGKGASHGKWVRHGKWVSHWKGVSHGKWVSHRKGEGGKSLEVSEVLEGESCSESVKWVSCGKLGCQVGEHQHHYAYHSQCFFQGL